MINVAIVGGGHGKQAAVNDDNSLRVSVVPPPQIQSASFGKVVVGVAGALSLINWSTYNEQTTAALRSINSDNAADAGAGTGAQQVKITYYDTLLQGPFTETVVMNGLTLVTTTNNNIAYVEKMEVVRVGSGQTNAGNITLHITAGGVGTIGTITTGLGRDLRTYWAQHYIPSGRKLVLGSVTIGTNGTLSGESFLTFDNPVINGVPDIQFAGSLIPGTNSITQVLVPQVVIFGPGRIRMWIIPVQKDQTWFGSFEWAEQDIQPGDRSF